MSLIELLKSKTPLRLDDYMEQCLFHETYGYYKHKNPLGEHSDFITAPETSQLFGEMIALFYLSLPTPYTLIELGPGRGLLMQDILRVSEKYVAPNVHMVETNPVLQSIQQNNLRGFSHTINWHKDITTLPQEPTFFIANEFFDVFPIRQFKFHSGSWHEVYVIWDDSLQSFTYNLQKETEDLTPLLSQHNIPQKGDVFEYSPQQYTYLTAIFHHIKTYGGALLLIDYGYLGWPYGNTLQALQQHNKVSIFHQPGQCDLTTHIAFDNIKDWAKQAGLFTQGPTTQNAFLRELGIEIRAKMLNNKMVDKQLKRLIGDNEMGQLFKALFISQNEYPPHPGFLSC